MSITLISRKSAKSNASIMTQEIMDAVNYLGESNK